MLGFSAEVANDHGHLPTRCGALPAARHQQDVRGPFYASRADEERAAQKGKGAPRRKQSLRTGRWKFGAAIERERPEKRFAMCGADEARSIQDRSHLLRRVHEDAKLVPSDPEEEVHYRESRPQVPAVGRMREGQQTSRSRSGGAEQGVCVGITAHDAVKRDDIGFRQRGGGSGEIAEHELGGAPSITRAHVAPRKVEISGRGIGKRGARQAGGRKFGSNYAYAGADVEKVQSPERPTADFGKEHTCAGVRTAALVTPLVARRHAGIEEARGSAIAGATRHTVHLEDRKSTRLNSSHRTISYAVFCMKKK